MGTSQRQTPGFGASEIEAGSSRELFQELIASGVVPLRPGVLRIVDEAIASDVPLAVCSTSNEAAVRTLVKTLMGSERYERFSFFCGDVVPQKKVCAHEACRART